jgi:rhodanese-related sulfurtransferase
VGIFLERRGFARVYNLLGGVDAWAREVDPSMAVY